MELIQLLKDKKTLTNFFLLRYFLFNNKPLSKEEYVFGSVDSNKFLSFVENEDFIESVFNQAERSNACNIIYYIKAWKEVVYNIEQGLLNLDFIYPTSDYDFFTEENKVQLRYEDFRSFIYFFCKDRNRPGVIVNFEDKEYLFTGEITAPLYFSPQESWIDICNRTEKVDFVLRTLLTSDSKIDQRLNFFLGSMLKEAGLQDRRLYLNVISKDNSYTIDYSFWLSNGTRPVSLESYDNMSLSRSAQIPFPERLTLFDFESNFTNSVEVGLNVVSEKGKVYVEFTPLKNLKSFIEKGSALTKTKVSLGKLLKSTLPEKPSMEIEAAVNVVKSVVEPPIIEIVSGYDIAKYYNGHFYSEILDTGTLKGSCMKYDCCQMFFGIYVRNSNVKLLILKSPVEHDRIIGRALIWENAINKNFEGTHTIIDRYYGPDKYAYFIQKFAKEKGWWCKERNQANSFTFIPPNSDESVHTYYFKVPLENSSFRMYPYMDTFRGLDSEGYLDCESECMQFTDGDHYDVEQGLTPAGTESVSYFFDVGDEYNYEADYDAAYDYFKKKGYDIENLELCDCHIYKSSEGEYLPDASISGFVATYIPTAKEYEEQKNSKIVLKRQNSNYTLNF